jgi:hypothetical protein
MWNRHCLTSKYQTAISISASVFGVGQLERRMISQQPMLFLPIAPSLLFTFVNRQCATAIRVIHHASYIMIARRRFPPCVRSTRVKKITCVHKCSHDLSHRRSNHIMTHLLTFLRGQKRSARIDLPCLHLSPGFVHQKNITLPSPSMCTFLNTKGGFAEMVPSTRLRSWIWVASLLAL